MVGIDPGLTRCGFAVVDSTKGSLVQARSLGAFTTSPQMDLPNRLASLQRDVRELLDEFSPDAVAVEKVFFQVNVKTAMSVGQASGVALAEAASSGCIVAQYTPNEVKMSIAGYGGADKQQVQRMVQQRLGLSAPPQPADAADAAALALCYLATSPLTAAVHAALEGRS
ncbi:MAG: crossover junction endodeoxyribonuclease RuvC [Actinobacteria bacterium]|nr:crossover junction endodeoxyribonuclease RuvC [Actinomycetota bacterium]